MPVESRAIFIGHLTIQVRQPHAGQRGPDLRQAVCGTQPAARCRRHFRREFLRLVKKNGFHDEIAHSSIVCLPANGTFQIRRFYDLLKDFAESSTTQLDDGTLQAILIAISPHLSQGGAERWRRDLYLVQQTLPQQNHRRGGHVGTVGMSYTFPMRFSHTDIIPLDEALAEPVAYSAVKTMHFGYVFGPPIVGIRRLSFIQ